MVLWTIVPMEYVFQDFYSKNPEYEEINYGGVTLELEKISATQRKIVRIISSDPQDYLRQDIQPGNTISYSIVS